MIPWYHESVTALGENQSHQARSEGRQFVRNGRGRPAGILIEARTTKRNCCSFKHLACLPTEWFGNRIAAKVVFEIWRHEYNIVRPHSSPGYMTPLEFKQSLTHTNLDGAIFHK